VAGLHFVVLAAPELARRGDLAVVGHANPVPDRVAADAVHEGPG
jgi:hypothetical protein